MEDNPYRAMVETMRSAGAAPGKWACLGEVLQPEPLQVLVEGNAMEAERLLVNPALLKGYAAKVGLTAVSGDLAVTASCPEGSHSDMGVNGGALEATATRLEPELQKGDQLLLLPIESRQRYVVVCRVVSL